MYVIAKNVMKVFFSFMSFNIIENHTTISIKLFINK